VSHLAEWRAGGGGSYCATCEADGEPCARGLTDASGWVCPEHLHRPETVEGAAALALVGVPGLWRRAGLNGTLVGFNYAAGEAFRPAEADPETFRELLTSVEAGALRAVAKQNRDERDG
jgi:hypothetical protein